MHLHVYVNNKIIRLFKIKATVLYCVHSINSCSFIFMSDIPQAWQGCPEDWIWPAGRKMPRSALIYVSKKLILQFFFPNCWCNLNPNPRYLMQPLQACISKPDTQVIEWSYSCSLYKQVYKSKNDCTQRWIVSRARSCVPSTLMHYHSGTRSPPLALWATAGESSIFWKN